jgi:hypothetical protein
MIPKSGYRFSEKIMLQQDGECDSTQLDHTLEHARFKSTPSRRIRRALVLEKGKATVGVAAITRREMVRASGGSPGQHRAITGF